MRPGTVLRICALLLGLRLCPLAALSQVPQTDAATLHVYVNLMQIPVLLLDEYRHSIRPVPESRFLVSLEGMPPFHPARVRLEGEDPISLAVLVDRSESYDTLMEHLPRAAESLVRSLRPHDRVELYGIDGCRLRRFEREEALDPQHVLGGLAAAAALRPYVLDRKQKGACAAPVSLWDALLYLGKTMNARPGRRVILALTNGQPSGSAALMQQLKQVLNGGSVSLFGVTHESIEPFAPSVLAYTAPLTIQSELSGGMVLPATIHSLPATLRQVMERVRGRYIVEFTRPPNLAPGERSITVSIGKSRAFIRPAGISVPIASAAEMAVDPSVQHGPLNQTGSDHDAQPAGDLVDSKGIAGRSGDSSH